MDARTTQLNFSPEHFICPITQDIFFDPACASPCGHPFERSAICRYIENNDLCPCCKNQIEMIGEVPPLFREILEEFLKKNLTYDKQRYFSFELFKYEFSKKKTPQSQIRINKILTHLKKYPHLLNATNSVEHKETLLYDLVSETEGQKLICNYPDFFDLINETSLNLVNKNGNAPLTWLASHPGFKKKIINKNFLQKINSQGLNTIDKLEKDSPLFWLMYDSSYIFVENPELINMITADALNAIVYQPAKFAGSSALYWLIKNDYQLLKQNQYLQSLVRYEGLLGIYKSNIGEECNTWILPNIQELKEMINRMVCKNLGLNFLHHLLEDIIKKENPDEVINKLNNERTAYYNKKKASKLSLNSESDSLSEDEEEVTVASTSETLNVTEPTNLSNAENDIHPTDESESNSVISAYQALSFFSNTEPTVTNSTQPVSFNPTVW